MHPCDTILWLSSLIVAVALMRSLIAPSFYKKPVYKNQYSDFSRNKKLILTFLFF